MKDDLGNQIVSDTLDKPPKEELLDMLDIMARNIEQLPPEALYSPVCQAELASVLLLLSSILRSF